MTDPQQRIDEQRPASSIAGTNGHLPPPPPPTTAAPAPTVYGGFTMRSRLQAPYAAFFTELGWRWRGEDRLAKIASQSLERSKHSIAISDIAPPCMLAG
jgi:hypothetical protein